MNPHCSRKFNLAKGCKKTSRCPCSFMQLKHHIVNGITFGWQFVHVCYMFNSPFSGTKQNLMRLKLFVISRIKARSIKCNANDISISEMISYQNNLLIATSNFIAINGQIYKSNYLLSTNHCAASGLKPGK